MATPQQQADGFIDLRSGMNEALSPALIPDTAVARAINTSFRKILPHTRPGLVEAAYLPQGTFQGAGVWSLDSGDRIVFVVDGTVYTLEVDTMRIANHGTILDTEAQCYFAQVDRYMIVQDAQRGDANITLTVSDGTNSSETVLQVVSEDYETNDAVVPVVTGLADLSVAARVKAGPYPFTVTYTGDEDIEVTVDSSDESVVPYGGAYVTNTDGDNWTLHVTPNQVTSGHTYLTIKVTAGAAVVTRMLKVTVPALSLTLAQMLNPSLVWDDAGSGTLRWETDTEYTLAAPWSAKAVLDPDTSSMNAKASVVVDGGTTGGTLRFNWACRCGSSASFVCEYEDIDGGASEVRIRGTEGWSSETINIAAGDQRITWTYNGTTVPDDNGVWLESVIFRPSAQAEVSIAAEVKDSDLRIPDRTVVLTLSEALDVSVDSPVLIAKPVGGAFEATVQDVLGAASYRFIWATGAAHAPTRIGEFFEPGTASELSGTTASRVVSKGDNVPLTFDFSRSWLLEFNGEFPLDSHKRFAGAPGAPRRGLDFFMWGNKIASRIDNELVRFGPASVGSRTSSAPPDHWAQSVDVGRITRNNHVVKFLYTPSGSWKAWYDGSLVMDISFTRRGTPPTLSSIIAKGFNGTIKVTSGA